MTYSDDLTDILDEVISAMTFPVQINSVILNSDGTQTLNCCDIYFAQKGFNVTINSTQYLITDFDQANETITVSGSGTITPQTFNLYTPTFFHGTPIATTEEINEIKDANTKTPMIWLWENFHEKYSDRFDPVDRSVDIELFFLTQADFEKWQTQDAYDEAIKPMKRLRDLFIDELDRYPNRFYTDKQTFESDNYAKFGVYARTRGSQKNLMADKLSGVGTKIPLKIYKKIDCDNCTL